MHPAETASPPNRFTPSRLLWLSRPFLELRRLFYAPWCPGPFAAGQPTRISVTESVVNGWAMPLFLREALPPLVLVDGDLLPLAVPDRRADDGGAPDGGSPDGGSLSVDTISTSVSSTVAPGSTESFSTLTTSPGRRELLPPGADDCVHRIVALHAVR